MRRLWYRWKLIRCKHLARLAQARYLATKKSVQAAEVKRQKHLDVLDPDDKLGWESRLMIQTDYHYALSHCPVKKSEGALADALIEVSYYENLLGQMPRDQIEGRPNETR